MKKIILLCCVFLSLSLNGMQMSKDQITPTEIIETNSSIEHEKNSSSSEHHICTKSCVCLWCCGPALAADILCCFPLLCRLTPIQGNESDIEWINRAHSNHEAALEHRTTQKEKYGNDACSSLKRKINHLFYEKAPHHTERCEAEYEHLCCFSKAIVKFIKE